MKPFWRTIDRPTPLDPNWNDEFLVVAQDVLYKDGYGLLLAKDKKDPAGRWYFQVECERPDTFTGQMGVGRGGKGYLSPHMTRSELSRMLLGLFLAYEEHECREFFKWRGKAVYGPHIDVDALHEVADRMDFR